MRKNQTSAGPKKTKAQIARMQALEQMARDEEIERKRLEKLKIGSQPELVENLNRAETERIENEGIHLATNINEAINVLGGDSVDKHPEKRVKSAYKIFEESRYPDLKAENPSLKMSQLRQIIKKEWKKSPDNPLNQQ